MQNDAERIMDIKRLMATTAYKSQSEHLPSSLSALDILFVLYNKIANISPENADDPERDRVIISKEHCRLAQICVLVEAGLVNKAILDHYMSDSDAKAGHDLFNAVYAGHDRKLYNTAAIDPAFGSLGHGLPLSVGMAWDGKHKVYTLVGDGELQEGSNYEALMFAGHHKMANLMVVIDNNGVQVDSYTKDFVNFDYHRVFSGFGFHVVECDGHNTDDIETALRTESDKPKCIIANTLKGKESLFLVNKYGFSKYHRLLLTDDDYAKINTEIDA